MSYPLGQGIHQVREVVVDLREAKANLSHLASRAKAGTRVVITSHGIPIADLVPHGTGGRTQTVPEAPRATPKADEVGRLGTVRFRLGLRGSAGLS